MPDQYLFQSATPFLPASSVLLTTGYVLPLLRRPGDTLSVPFIHEAPLLAGNDFWVQLAGVANETILVESVPTAHRNPLFLIVPTNLPTGSYRVRIQTSQPVFTSTWSEPFGVDVDANRVFSQTAASPFVVGGQSASAITLQTTPPPDWQLIPSPGLSQNVQIVSASV